MSSTSSIRKTVRRGGVILVWMASAAWAQPPLTTIQDVLFKADGTRFSGQTTIRWNSFDAADGSNISTQNVTVRVVDGYLRVQLVPTTNAGPGARYQVIYNSDGAVQFEETWAVPPSAAPLRVRDVRAAPSAPFNSGNLTTAGTITEEDVAGLVADLALRPMKGPGFSTSRVAAINETGEIESVLGGLSDCVRVDGTAGACGGESAPTYVDNEIPGGLVDGSNLSFFLSSNPNPAGSLALYRNGIMMKPAFDYTILGNIVTFVNNAPPQSGDTLLASYRVGAVNPSDTAVRPEVVCSSAGAATTAGSLTSLGTCKITGGTLLIGDRVEFRFDYSHEGNVSGFSFDVQWGSTTLISRAGAAGESAIAGHAEMAVTSTGVRHHTQSWGELLSFAAGVGSAADSLLPDLTVSLRGSVATPGFDTVTLRNFTVVKYPVHSNP